MEPSRGNPWDFSVEAMVEEIKRRYRFVRESRCWACEQHIDKCGCSRARNALRDEIYFLQVAEELLSFLRKHD